MQHETNTRSPMVYRASSKTKGIKEMPMLETFSLGEALKWLAGAVLIPWLWFERKRVDKLVVDLSANHFTKEECKEQIILRNQPIEDKLDMIIDEVTKKREYKRKGD